MFGGRRDHRGCKISPMQLAILLVLTERPMYGYEVLKVLRDRFEGAWTPQTGSIYPALKRLAESGLTSQEQRDGTDYYSLTEEGMEQVRETLRHAPRDIRLLSKYFDLLGETAIRLHVEEPPGGFSEMFEKEDADQAEHVKKLRRARERIAQHLADIDLELSEIESEERGGR